MPPVVLPSGEVLVAGGGYSDGDGLDTSALYDPDDNSWTNTGAQERQTNGLTLTLLDVGWVLAIGGYNASRAETTAELYEPASRRGAGNSLGSSGPGTQRARLDAAAPWKGPGHRRQT